MSGGGGGPQPRRLPLGEVARGREGEVASVLGLVGSMGEKKE